MKEVFENWKYCKAIVGYNGFFFEGWQSQNHKNTVQDVIEKILYSLFKKIQKIIGASRTDSGVHARGQVFTFYAPGDISIDKLLFLINKKLPFSIVIFSIEEVAISFHPRYDAKKKIYEYRVSEKKMCPLFIHNAYNLGFSINRELLYKNLRIFVGTYNFTFFSYLESNQDAIRTIYDISFNEEDNGNILCISILGNGFLRYMIRKIVGSAIFITQKNIDNCFLKEMLFPCEKNAKNIRLVKKITSNGLTLASIKY